MSSPPRPTRPPRHDAHRAAVLWSLAGVIGVTVAVTIALKVVASSAAPALGALAAIGAGWAIMLAFAPWRPMRRICESRRVILEMTRELRKDAVGRRDRPFGAALLERDDELGALSRAIRDTLGRAAADRREHRMLQRSLDETVRRETDRATLRLQREAATDPLTGLGNRRTLERKLKEFFSVERRRRRDALAAMVIDVDLFKEVNDTLGHDFGDQCLSFLGNLLSSTLRGEDCAIRIGGDEFTVLMPNLSLEEAKAVGRRLSALFAQMPWPHAKVRKPTLSIGIAVEWCSDPGGAEELLRRADAALYRSKDEGRNTIRAYGDRRGAA